PDQTRSLYQHAVENRYAVLSINADSPAAIVDCLLTASELKSPVIIETSLWQLTGHSFGAGDPLLGVNRYIECLRLLGADSRFEEVPIVYHTDHIKGPDTYGILTHAMAASASSISLDSSDLSAEENIRLLGQLCTFATENGLPATLEMEAGVDDGVTPLEETRSLFGSVEKLHPGYLALWAPGSGTQHGLGDMGGFDPDAVQRHQTLASDLAGRAIGIALHGSSGLTPDQLKAAVQAGVAKVNWSSESLLIRSGALRRYYTEKAEQLEKGHPDFKTTAMDHGPQQFVSSLYRPIVAERLQHLGSPGQAASFLQSLN
ncbi:MAG: class II fructose-bisphosphate aldolase, partial [Verrucomicrobiota bacterium]